ncbi:MAG: methyl-accepting chemotaxis protein [Oscillospiraceae bacterium]
MKFIKNMKLNGKIAIIILPMVLLAIANVIFLSLNMVKVHERTMSVLSDTDNACQSLVLNADRDLYQSTEAEITLYNTKGVFTADQTKDTLADFNDNLKFADGTGAVDRINKAYDIFAASENGDTFKESESGKTFATLKKEFESTYETWRASFDIEAFLSGTETAAGTAAKFTAHQDDFNTMRETVNLMGDLIDQYGTYETGIIQDDMDATIRFTVIFVSIIILLVGFLAFIVSMNISGGVKKISSTALKIAKGDLNIFVNPEDITNDEIGQLTNSVSQIADRLRGYVKYIAEITDVLQTMANGDMRVSLTSDYAGEFASIKKALLEISGSLNTTLLSISESSAQVNTGANQVASASQSLSQGATEQASSIQELAATISEISGQVKTTAGNTEQVLEQMQVAGKEVGSGDKQMRQMIAAMNEINDSSNQISKIIKVIDDIAFQTNILALNAAVEAARAGAAGKGFAVVADEVRNLAAKSAAAAKDTTELIEASIEKVNDGTDIANSTAQSLEKIVTAFGAVDGLIREIADATQIQSRSIEQVSQGIDQISAVVQTNSATAEESAAASEELTGQVTMLDELISKFKLKKSGASHGFSGGAAKRAPKKSKPAAPKFIAPVDDDDDIVIPKFSSAFSYDDEDEPSISLDDTFSGKY